MRTLFKLVLLLFLFIALTNTAITGVFAPSMLKIEAPSIVDYRFDNTAIEIPVMVSGTPCELIFCVFTQSRAPVIEGVCNGFLGWHYVNKTDTCLYASPPYRFGRGTAAIPWDGRDQDGAYLTPEVYSYYIWAYDCESEKQPVCRHVDTFQIWATTLNVQETDEQGLPLTKPFWYRHSERWYIGSDPDSLSALVTTNIVPYEGWNLRGVPCLDTRDFDYVYAVVSDDYARRTSMHRYRFVPGGDAEIDTGWGREAPFAATYATTGGGSPGVVTDGDYLYTAGESNVSSTDPDGRFFIYDTAGLMIEEVDLTPWWSSEEDLNGGGQTNGGPTNIALRSGSVFLSAHGSCLVQMIDPSRYLESGSYDDLFVWANGNGDYVFDRNVGETAWNPWVCNDYNAPPYTYGISADANLFSVMRSWGIDGTSFGLLAPDGTGLGYHMFAGERNGFRKGMFIVDGGTPYDGIYCDHIDVFDPHSDWSKDREKLFKGVWYIAHDSVRGYIRIPPDCFGETETVKIYSPKAGDILTRNQSYRIQWNECCHGRITVEFSSDGGESWAPAGRQEDASIPYLYWKAPETVSDNCMIRVYDTDNPDKTAVTGPFSIVDSSLSADAEKPRGFSLGRNTPNPFNPVTVIPFTLASDAAVTLTVYNVAGERIAVLADGFFPAGEHRITWDASGYASGVYIYRLTGLGLVDTGKMVLVR